MRAEGEKASMVHGALCTIKLGTDDSSLLMLFNSIIVTHNGLTHSNSCYLHLVREKSQLINFSPKRKHLFADKVFENDGPSVRIKNLCPTRWTARTAAIESVLKKSTKLLWNNGGY